MKSGRLEGGQRDLHTNRIFKSISHADSRLTLLSVCEATPLFGLLFVPSPQKGTAPVNASVSPKHFCPFSISHRISTYRVAFSPPSPSSPTETDRYLKAKAVPKVIKNSNLCFLDSGPSCATETDVSHSSEKFRAVMGVLGWPLSVCARVDSRVYFPELSSQFTMRKHVAKGT